MAKDRTQPTPIDKNEYEAFKNFVRDVHGSTRGHLSSEIEKALREYRKRTSGAERLQRIENDIATIKANIADVESDGGAVASTPSEASDTHARNMSKPAPNQPRKEKVSYLYNRFLEKEGCNNDSGTLTRGAIETIVKKQYGFDGEILDDYVDRVFNKVEKEYNPVPHPVHGSFLVWGDRLEDAKQEAEEIAQEEMEDME